MKVYALRVENLSLVSIAGDYVIDLAVLMLLCAYFGVFFHRERRKKREVEAVNLSLSTRLSVF